MENSPIHPKIVQMLQVAEKIFSQFDIDFYLVGAVARDLHFSAKKDLAPVRKTKDVDIAINVGQEEQFYDLKAALIDTGEFTAHESETIKLFFQKAIEVDLLPFGGIENANRETKIEKPKLFVMDMPGFRELEPHAIVTSIEGMQGLKIASLEGLVLLKLFAYDDDPSRTKDITDIDHIITVYFDLHSEIIWDNYEDFDDVMEKYPTDNPLYLQLVSSRIIGRKLSQFLARDKKLLKRIKQIIAKRPTEQWNAMLDGTNDA